MGKLMCFAVALTMVAGTAYAESGKPAVRVYTPPPNYTYEELSQKVDDLRSIIDQLVIPPDINHEDGDFPWLIVITYEETPEKCEPIFQF